MPVQFSGKADAAARPGIARLVRNRSKAFQIADDCSTSKAMQDFGQTAAKMAAGKATLVATLGIDKARGRLNELVEDASAALASLLSENQIHCVLPLASLRKDGLKSREGLMSRRTRDPSMLVRLGANTRAVADRLRLELRSRWR
jgi:hypothetical protein